MSKHKRAEEKGRPSSQSDSQMEPTSQSDGQEEPSVHVRNFEKTYVAPSGGLECFLKSLIYRLMIQTYLPKQYQDIFKTPISELKICFLKFNQYLMICLKNKKHGVMPIDQLCSLVTTYFLIGEPDSAKSLYDVLAQNLQSQNLEPYQVTDIFGGKEHPLQSLLSCFLSPEENSLIFPRELKKALEVERLIMPLEQKLDIERPPSPYQMPLRQPSDVIPYADNSLFSKLSQHAVIGINSLVVKGEDARCVINFKADEAWQAQVARVIDSPVLAAAYEQVCTPLDAKEKLIKLKILVQQAKNEKIDSSDAMLGMPKPSLMVFSHVLKKEKMEDSGVFEGPGGPDDDKRCGLPIVSV